MGHDLDRIKECPECGSDNRKRLNKEFLEGQIGTNMNARTAEMNGGHSLRELGI